MGNSALVLERLSKNKNFNQWNFGRLDKIIEPTETPPWEGEPDKVQWIDPETDFDCLILRNRSGALCGYVGVPPGHPFHGIQYMEDSPLGRPESELEVHGLLTFSDFCTPGEPEDGICHHAAPGRPAKVWWLGFDCAHSWDWIPLYNLDFQKDLPRLPGEPEYRYRNLEFVVDQITQLAKQLADL